MSRKRKLSLKHKVIATIGAAALVGGIAVVTVNTSQAAEACGGLDTALKNNQNFVAGQKANPDANSAGRIANRQAVIDQIQQRRKAAGCTDGDEGAAGAGQAGQGDQSGQAGAADKGGAADKSGAAGKAAGAGAGEQVCKGQNLTLSGEGGAPAASSDQFAKGTQLKVTNLDNDKSTTVKVTSTSGSCVLLNNAAFEQVRQAGKNVIRNAQVERVG